MPSERRRSSTSGKKSKAYHGVKCNGNSGSLILTSNHVVFKPKKEDDGDGGGGDKRYKLAWEDVVEIQKSSSKAKKHKIKISSFESEKLVFQVKSRELLLKIYQDITQRQEGFFDENNQEDFSARQSKEEQLSSNNNESFNESSITLTNSMLSESLDEELEGSFSDFGGDSSHSINERHNYSVSEWSASPKRGNLTLLPPMDGDNDNDDDVSMEKSLSPVGTSEFHNVIWEDYRGNLILKEDKLIFQEEQEGGGVSCGTSSSSKGQNLFQLTWGKLYKHKISKAKSQKFVLRLYIDNSETYETFHLSNRESLEKAKYDIRRFHGARLLRDAQANMSNAQDSMNKLPKLNESIQLEGSETSITLDMSQSQSIRVSESSFSLSQQDGSASFLVSTPQPSPTRSPEGKAKKKLSSKRMSQSLRESLSDLPTLVEQSPSNARNIKDNPGENTPTTPKKKKKRSSKRSSKAESLELISSAELQASPSSPREEKHKSEDSPKAKKKKKKHQSAHRKSSIEPTTTTTTTMMEQATSSPKKKRKSKRRSSKANTTTSASPKTGPMLPTELTMSQMQRWVQKGTKQHQHQHQQQEEETKLQVKPLQFHYDGQDGKDGTNGKPGKDGVPGGGGGGKTQLVDREGGNGGPAGTATPGGNAENIEIKLLEGTEQNIHVQVNIQERGQVFSQEFRPSEFPNISWSARGGYGGNGGKGGDGGQGADGRPGKDATESHIGKDGEDAGDGGDGGPGSDGMNGGNGGQVVIRIADERDTYLLMALEDCDNINQIRELVSRGSGGRSGSHGKAGQGGTGGRGGNQYPPAPSVSGTKALDSRRKSQAKVQSMLEEGDDLSKSVSEPSSGDSQVKCKGGRDGEHGEPGSELKSKLMRGKDGTDGRFRIVVSMNEKTYSSRYNLLFMGAQFGSEGMIDASRNSFEFGATVFCKDIEVMNDGGMPTPSRQRAMISIKGDTDEYVSVLTQYASFTPSNRSLRSGESCKTEGALAFQIPLPDIRSMGDDLDPFEHKVELLLQATQLGPESSQANGQYTPFQRPYEVFHAGGSLPLKFAFPVANMEGIVGMRSLAAGEMTRLSFMVRNTGNETLGNSTRKVCVQFYRSQNEEYKTNPASFTFLNENEEQISIEPSTANNDQMLQGNSVFLDNLLPGETVEFTRYLKLSEDAEAYSHVGIQAEILVQSLSSSDMFVVQRRHIRVVAEPSYVQVEGAKVVLVTSALAKEQVCFWELLLADMGIPFECYAVSRYGSLAADYEVSRGLHLCKAFEHKLVVVLNNEFEITEGRRVPISSLLPQGCLQQASGYSSSTRWLLVNRDDQIESSLLDARVCSQGNLTTRRFSTMKGYKQFICSKLKPGDGFETGIQRCIISVKQPRWKLQIAARRLCRWLKTKEPLRQHRVLYSADDGSISVLHGFSRPYNSTVVVNGKLTDNGCVIRGPPMCVALAEAMSPTLLVETFCQVVRDPQNHPPFVLEALKDAATTAFLWDVANYVDSGGKDQRLPSLEVWHNNLTIAELLQMTTPEIEMDLVDLASRFAAVAHSKDLCIWGLMMWSPLRKHLMAKVNNLILFWGLHISKVAVEENRLQVKMQVKDFIRRTRGKIFLGMHQRWRKSLLCLHSNCNKDKYTSDISTFWLMEAAIDCAGQQQEQQQQKQQQQSLESRHIRKPRHLVIEAPDLDV